MADEDIKGKEILEHVFNETIYSLRKNSIYVVKEVDLKLSCVFEELDNDSMYHNKSQHIKSEKKEYVLSYGEGWHKGGCYLSKWYCSFKC